MRVSKAGVYAVATPFMDSVMDLGVGLFVFALGVKGATRKDAKKHLSQAAVLSLIGIIRSVLVSLGVIGQVINQS